MQNHSNYGKYRRSCRQHRQPHCQFIARRRKKDSSRKLIWHVRKKYACLRCEQAGENPQIESAAKAKTAIEKGFAGPGLLAYIVTSKFADYLALYRLEDIFERQGFAISRAPQSVWYGDVADLVEPLYRRMAERVRQSHVVATDGTVFPMLGPGQKQSTRMWVHVGACIAADAVGAGAGGTAAEGCWPGKNSCCQSIPWRKP